MLKKRFVFFDLLIGVLQELGLAVIEFNRLTEVLYENLVLCDLNRLVITTHDVSLLLVIDENSVDRVEIVVKTLFKGVPDHIFIRYVQPF